MTVEPALLQPQERLPASNNSMPVRPLTQKASAGRLIVNADDWGRDQETTERILECVRRRSVSSVSAMVFMADSNRAASMARDRGLDAGLHLNLTTPFSGPGASHRLLEHQTSIARYLHSWRFAQALFRPDLVRSFEYVVMAQREEFLRAYGAEATRIDGHHHMHLCANVLLGGLLPSEIVVRRTFSFRAGEKMLLNRLYRKAVDRVLARRRYLTDFFFSLSPLVPAGRLQAILSLASTSIVEVETHPVNPDEYRFLAGGEFLNRLGGVRLANRYDLRLDRSLPN